MSEIQTTTDSTLASTPEQVEQDIQALEWRDFQLLGIAIVILLVIAAGFLALLMPQLIRKAEAQLSNRQEFTSLFFGLIGLLVLLNIYMFDQRIRLQRARRNLIHQLQRAERMARIDPLTGIPNAVRLRKRWKRKSADRGNNLPLTVMVSDVDNFKSFNTRFGHLTGDRVLMDVTSLLRKNFRASDFIVRYGGDEFVVVMPDTDLERARAAVVRLNRLIDAWNTSNPHCGYDLGLTCGLTEFVEGATVDELIQAADEDMYLRKCETQRRSPQSAQAAESLARRAEAN